MMRKHDRFHERDVMMLLRLLFDDR